MKQKDSKEENLDKLYEQIEVCQKCELSKNGCAVPGEGSAKAEVMFIGEAPGRVESETGRPFVGRAGTLLTGLIELIGLNRRDVFITSIVKHRPPKNRKPTQSEIDACLPYLQEQIKNIKPRIIVLLGTTALYAVLGKEIGKITDIHGRTIRRDTLTYFPTYHPAAGLRSTEKIRKQLELDFIKLRDLLNLNTFETSI